MSETKNMVFFFCSKNLWAIFAKDLGNERIILWWTSQS